MGLDWTDVDVAALKEKWAAGWSASQIGDSIGRTRNAIISKVHSQKLPVPQGKRVKSGPRKRIKPKPTTPTPPPAARLRNGYDPSLRRNPSHNILAAITIAGTEPGLSEKLKGEAPDGTGIKLIDLDESRCRWPKGDPAQPDFEFCGARSIPGRPYCAHHSAIASAPPRARASADRLALHRADLKS